MLYFRLGTLVDCIMNAYSKLCSVRCCFYNLASGNNLAAIKMSRLRGIAYKQAIKTMGILLEWHMVLEFTEHYTSDKR